MVRGICTTKYVVHISISLNYKHLNINYINFIINYECLFMSFYIYKLVVPLILSNTSINLSIISHQLSAISYQPPITNYLLFLPTKPKNTIL